MRLLLSLLLACSLAGCLKPVDTNPVVDNTTPVVAGSNLLIVVVENFSERTVDSPESNTRFWEELRKRGTEFRIVDKDNPYATKFDKQVKRHGVPCILIVRTSDGRVLKSCPRPENEQLITELLGKYGVK